MNSKLKVLTITMVTMAVAGVLLYTPLSSALQSCEADPASEADCVEGKEWVWWFLNNSEPTVVEGVVAALLREMLVVNTCDGQMRIVLPEEWTVDTEVMTRDGLFTSGYLSVGENITISALRANIIEKEGLCIYASLGYEIVDDSDIHAYAALPLNIET